MEFFIETFLIGIGLSMDAFAVSICKGLGMPKIDKKQTLIIALYFGGFQALMPLLGWWLSIGFSKYVSAYAHWIALILLAFIGGKMIYESFEEDDNCKENKPISHKELFILAIATSIDALAVGISFAFLNKPILPSITIIGITTFIFSIAGVIIGNIFGTKYKNKAELAGGLILIFIGLKIVLEHYFF